MGLEHLKEIYNSNENIIVVKCECGIEKIYGKEATPHMHYAWCPKYKKE